MRTVHSIWYIPLNYIENSRRKFENTAPISTLLTLFAWRIHMYATNDASHY